MFGCISRLLNPWVTAQGPSPMALVTLIVNIAQLIVGTIALVIAIRNRK
jgi:hypothetical protein